MLYGRLENEHFTYGLGGKGRKELKAVYAPSGISAINRAVLEGKALFVPEGEKDVDTLIKQGYAAAFTYGGASDWLVEMAQLCKGAVVYILADNDEAGRRVATTIYKDLQGVAKCAKIIVPMPEIPKADISDYFAAGHSKEEFETLLKQEAVTDNHRKESIPELDKDLTIANVLSKLAYKVELDSNGNEKSRKLLQTVKNFEIALEEDARFTGKLKFDEFSQQVYLLGEVPWSQKDNYRAWSSYDDSALFSILQSDYGLNRRPDFFDALKNVSMQHSFHPVRDILNGLTWDGKDWIRGLLPDYLGAEDSQYTYEVMKLFLLGGVARIFEPGIKFDYTMILQGPQGVGKSTFLKELALKPEWFNDSLDSLDSDKAAQSLLGSWIIELAELKALARTGGGTDSIKRFLTAQQDKYRIPYERRADVFPRQCIFSGTTNKSDFLADETGNRRFLIVPTGITKPKKNLFIPEAREDILQAWAQAVHSWKTQQPELILPESCREVARALQRESVSDDGKIGIITEYLKDKSRICALEIWQKALNESGRPQKWQAGEINNIISAIPGWKKMKNPGRFGEFGFQRGFEYVNNKLENVNKDFVVVDDEEISEIPFN